MAGYARDARQTALEQHLQIERGEGERHAAEDEEERRPVSVEGVSRAVHGGEPPGEEERADGQRDQERYLLEEATVPSFRLTAM